jgi:DNA-binding transcriptional MerR regulator
MSRTSKSDRSEIRIGALVQQTGVTRSTIHHYVGEGLIPEPRKTAPNMAFYPADTVSRVLLIKGLQQHSRRSLAEVKALMEQATDGEGLDRLHRLLEVEAMRARSSPLEAAEPRRPLTITELAERTGFSREALGELEAQGLITARSEGRRRLYPPADVDVADALAGLAQAGFEAYGFEARDAVVYLDALRRLLLEEVKIFLARARSGRDHRDVVALAGEGIERVTPLILALRRKLIHELLESTPLSRPSGRRGGRRKQG